MINIIVSCMLYLKNIILLLGHIKSILKVFPKIKVIYHRRYDLLFFEFPTLNVCAVLIFNKGLSFSKSLK